MKLLLAEDDAILADALSASLAKAGFEVEVAPNGAVAEFLLLKQHFDLGVLDLGLPMVDGLTVLKRVRAAKPALPMLVLMYRNREGSFAAAWKVEKRTMAGLAAVALAAAGVRLFLPKSEAVAFNFDNPMVAMDAGARLISALKMQFVYLRQLFALVDYNFLYTAGDFPLPPGMAEGAAYAALALFLLAGGFLSWRKGAPEGTLALFAAISAFITSNIPFPIGVFLAERLYYLPSAWVLAAFAFAAARLAGYAKRRNPALGAGVLALAFLPAVPMAAVTFQRNALFREPLKLFERALAGSPGNPYALNGIAVAKDEAGDYVEAEKYYVASLRAAPAMASSYEALARFYLERERFGECVDVAEDCSGKENVAAMYGLLARCGAEAGDLAFAERWAEAAPNPFLTDVVFARGIIAEARGDEEALKLYAYADAKKPSPRTAMHYGRLLIARGKAGEARKVLARAAARWNRADLYNYLGIAAASEGDVKAAAESFGRAVSLSPGNEGYRANLSRALGEK